MRFAWAKRALRTLTLALFGVLLSGRSARAQYPFVPPPVPCVPRGEGAGILAGVASTRPSEIPHRNLAVLQFTQLPSRDEPDAALSGLRNRLLARLRETHARQIREYVGPAEIGAGDRQERVLELTTVGKQLNSRHLLVGRISQDGGTAVILLESFEAASGKRLWQTTRSVPVTELLRVEPELARLIASHEFGAVGIVDSVALSESETDDGVAYAHYVRGLAYLGDTLRLRDAAAELEAATQRAPKFAIAFSALAAAYSRRAATVADDATREPVLRLAQSAADRAMELEPKAAHAWIARGMLLAAGSPQRLGAARAAYERALVLDPTNTEAHRQLGRVLLLQGSADLAQTHLLLAVTLNPEDAAPLVDLGELEFTLHAFGQSCRALDLALSINPRVAKAYELRAMARLQRGDVRPAWVDAETGRRLGAELAGRAVSVLVDVAAHDTATARTHIKGAAQADRCEEIGECRRRRLCRTRPRRDRRPRCRSRCTRARSTSRFRAVPYPTQAGIRSVVDGPSLPQIARGLGCRSEAISTATAGTPNSGYWPFGHENSDDRIMPRSPHAPRGRTAHCTRCRRVHRDVALESARAE